MLYYNIQYMALLFSLTVSLELDSVILLKWGQILILKMVSSVWQDALYLVSVCPGRG